MIAYKTYRLATPEEIEQINKDADEAEMLYFHSGLADEPLIVAAPGRSEAAESQENLEGQAVGSRLPLGRTSSTTSESGG
jgi:hypothetical protein